MPAYPESCRVEMQLLPPLTRDPKIIAREKPASAHLPYLRHVDDVTIETVDGFLMQTICLDGLLFETADTNEINYRAQLRDAMLQAVGTPQFAVYHHVIRRKAETSLDAQYPDPFSRDLDERWRKRLASRQMYVNDLFLTIVRRPMQGQSGLLDRLRNFASRSMSGAAAEFAAAKRSLQAASEAIMASLANYGPRLLSVRQSPIGPHSEPLEFLGYLFNAEMRPMGLPHGPLADHLPFRRISFGQDALELAGAGIYTNLRHGYSDRIQSQLAALSAARSKRDYEEIVRRFREEMEVDLKDLRSELGASKTDLFLKPVVVATVAAAASMLIDHSGASAAVLFGLGAVSGTEPKEIAKAVGEFFDGGLSFGRKQKDVMAKHPMAYMYELSSIRS